MKFEIIPTKAILYDKCENVEQLYDNFYYPLLVEYKELKKQLEENKQLKDQLQQKDNIIKEVREYITYWHYRNDFRVNSFTTGVKEELLKILDKVD